ncbi:M24 family metallopeptidase C-terminal domain-containing protein [Rheinheimera sp.]|uniref:M24 family metallopeptidase C-terminal domain-containing protein n=1 Tax=Rheinheimera sp. TaxID=1869214 RepID=UPI003AF913B7
MTPEDRSARSRFFTIGAVRLAGAVTIALAVAISYGRIDSWVNNAGVDLLTGDERAWVDAYHARVLDVVGPQLEGEALDWLKAACAPL